MIYFSFKTNILTSIMWSFNLVNKRTSPPAKCWIART